MRRVIGLLVAALALCAIPVLADPGYATRDLELRSEPVGGSPVVGKLAKGAAFEITAEKGAWSQVSSGGLSGWTLSFFVMKGDAPAQASLGTRLGEVWSMGTERRVETTAVLGVRGLDEEKLASAQYNAAGLTKMESFAQSKAAAEAFARQGGLSRQQVEYLPAPAAVPAGPQQ